MGSEMAEDKRYILAKFAMEQGDRFQARDQLSSLLKDDPNNIEYWLLMSTVVESKKERVYCLKKVLALDPRNRDARLGMILFGGQDAGKVRSAALKKKDWLKEVPDIRKQEPKKKEKSRYNYKQLTPLLVGSVVVLLVLVLTGVFPGTRSIFSPKLTITPIPWTPTAAPGMGSETAGTPIPESTGAAAGWISFANFFGLKNADGKTAPLAKKSIYYFPTCDGATPKGGPGGENFGVLAKIPVLVD